jgi:hypothetical protein
LWVDAFLVFELPNLMSCRSKFSRFVGDIPRPACAIDVVLTEPRTQRGLVDTEISGGLFDLPAFADER